MKAILPRLAKRLRTILVLVIVILLATGYWHLPISGQVIVASQGWDGGITWPKLVLDPANPQPNQEAVITVTDVQPWTHVKLAIDDASPTFLYFKEAITGGSWSWSWRITVPDRGGYEVVFYYACDTGCIERARFAVGMVLEPSLSRNTNRVPTKLGLVFADPNRDWHGRSGWDVELTYARQAEAEYWSIDDLAARVKLATDSGLRVLVRVDYDLGQAIPPVQDYQALDVYLKYLTRLARDARLKGVYGFIIGSSYNGNGSNSQAPDRLVTPEWYARVFSGYGAEPAHTNNVVETIRRENPSVQILVGPVRPWIDDQNGTLRHRIDVPWLNYMNTLVAALDEAAQADALNGVPFTAADGFAVQAPGRPDGPDRDVAAAANEPQVDYRRAEWDGAQAGFRVYRDWLEIINKYDHSRGLPVYISSTNTFTPDQAVVPAENYPRGWLSAALDEVNREPQVHALCWFIDSFPMDTQWEYFSLTRPTGLLVDAAAEYDQLLRTLP